jgi:hypothetical protein
MASRRVFRNGFDHVPFACTRRTYPTSVPFEYVAPSACHRMKSGQPLGHSFRMDQHILAASFFSGRAAISLRHSII